VCIPRGIGQVCINGEQRGKGSEQRVVRGGECQINAGADGSGGDAFRVAGA